MKTYIIRRRLLTTESGTITLKLPTNFGTPKAAIFYATNSTANDGSFMTTVAHPFISIGLAGNSGVSGGTHVNRSTTTMCRYSTTAGASLNTWTINTTAYVLEHSTSDGATIYRRLSCDSFSSDTITCTLTNVNTPTETCDLIITVFAGDDLTVGVNTILVPNTLNGTVTFSTLTFQPDCVLFTYPQQVAPGVGLVSAGQLGFQINWGAALRDGSLTQRNAGLCSINNATTVDHRCGVNNNSVAVGRRGGTDNVNAVTAFSTTGFTITVQTAAPGGTYPIYFLALKSRLSDYALGTISGPTASGAQTQTIALPFVPQCILGSMTHTPTTNINTRQTAGNSDNFSLFVAKGENISANRGTGTLSYNPSAATVTGTSTLFLQQLSIGDKLYDPLYTLIGTVGSISSDTSLILTALAAIAPTNGNSFYYKKLTQYNLSYGNDDANTTSGGNLFTKVDSVNAICADTAPAVQNMIGKINDFTTRNEFKIQYTTLNSTAATGAAGRAGWYLAIKNTDNTRRGVSIS